MTIRVLTGLAPGTKVLVDGVPYEARQQLSDGRIFLDRKTGDEILLTNAAQRQMASEYRLTLDDLPKNIQQHILRARKTSFETFTFAERMVAVRRLRYIQAIDKRPLKLRRLTRIIDECIEETFGTPDLPDVSAPSVVPEENPEAEQPETASPPTRAEAIRDRLLAAITRDMADGTMLPPDAKPPTARSVRRWYRLYYAAGQDIRVLLNFDCLKGNREDRYEDWVEEKVRAVIREHIENPTPVKYSQALKLACNAVREAAGEEQSLPKVAELRAGKDLLGQNLIARWVRQTDRFVMTTRQQGIFEARREFSVVEVGPQGDFPNHEWEVDHTLMDVFVIDDLRGKAYGRPWLTAIIDRYSRCIVGFSLSFAPPSWVSVMDAIRVAVARKEALLRAINGPAGNISNHWECYGLPQVLITDHGREFKSHSMDETAAVLNVAMMQTKPRKPWLKGKIERWFRRLTEELAHTIPGTTFSKFDKRKFYDSEEFAILTITQLNWVVAKWVVDVYHQTEHTKLRCSPAEMWRGGVTYKVPRTLPASLLEPLMGLVVDRQLLRGGIRYMSIRWDSEDFDALRRRLPKGSHVKLRIDPRKLLKAWAWDDKNRTWVEGTLKEPAEARGYSLDQWYFINTQRRENMARGMKRQAALEKAIADIREFIAGIQEGFNKSGAYKRYLEFTTQGRTAWNKVLPPHWDDENDAPPGTHSLGDTEIKNPKQTDSGPYAENSSPEDGMRETRAKARENDADGDESSGISPAETNASTDGESDQAAAAEEANASGDEDFVADDYDTRANPVRSVPNDDSQETGE